MKLMNSVVAGLFLGFCGLLTACGGGGDALPPLTPDPSLSPSPTPVPTPVIQQREIPPSATGDRRSNAYGDHEVQWPSALTAPEGAVIFLPGSGVSPAAYRELQAVAVERGQVVIGLAYVNDQAVNAICVDFFSNCHAEVRAEVIYGEDRSDQVDVPPHESVEGRLAALLEYLQQHEPTVAWERLLTRQGLPDWSRLTLIGHSQGGGHAAFIAQRQLVHRAVMLSATEPANWTVASGRTPVDRYYGLAHAEELGYSGIAASWHLLELPGTPVELHPMVAPTLEAHQYFLSDTDCGGDAVGEPLLRYHGCTAVDLHLSRDTRGVPLLRPLWRTWLTPRRAD